MSCSCNTAALRIFVRNVANIQVPSSQQVTPRALSGIHRPRTTTLPLHTRSLHTTRAVRTDSTEAVPEETTAAAEQPTAPKPVFRKVSAPANPNFEGKPFEARRFPRREPQKETRNNRVQEGDHTEPTQKKTKIRWRSLPEEERRELYVKHGKEMPDAAERQARRLEKQQQKLKEGGSGSGEDGEPVVKKHNPSNPKREDWQHQKNALKEKFPEGWKPLKKLSPDALEGIRALHKQFPETYTTEVLSQKFQVSPEAIRRILRSKWRPDPEEEIERQERWFKRGTKIWQRYAELGVKPPKKWREQGIKPTKYWKEGEEKTFKERHVANVKLHRNLL